MRREDRYGNYDLRDASTTEPGVPYEFFNYGESTHSAIGLGQGLTLGVNGAWGPLAMGGLAQLRRMYGEERRVIKSRKFVALPGSTNR